MALERDLERALERLSAGQLEALASAAGDGGALELAIAGPRPPARAAVAEPATGRGARPDVTGAGIALALRIGLRARAAGDAARSRAVWTGPCAAGEQRLTASVLHQLLAQATQRILLVSFAAHTLPAVAADLESAVER